MYQQPQLHSIYASVSDFPAFSTPTSPLFDNDTYETAFIDGSLLPSTTASNPSLALPVPKDDSSSSSGGSYLSHELTNWPPPPALAPTAVSPSADTSAPRSRTAAASASTSSSDIVVVPKKRKLSALTADERLERRRAQHRALDANRRQRELEAIERLRDLILQQHVQQQNRTIEAQPDDEADEKDDEDGAAGEEKKAGRLAVLESSVALIQQLTAACKRTEAACGAQGAQLSRVSNQLHTVAATIAQVAASSYTSAADPLPAATSASTSLTASASAMASASSRMLSAASSSFRSILPAAVIDQLEHSDRSHSLCQSGLNMLSSMCISVISVPLGVIIDMNNNFLHAMHARRTDLLHKPINLTTLHKRIPQYPAAIAETEAVMSGRKRQTQAMWRCRTFDGVKFEMRCTFWGDFDVPPSPDGTPPRAPDRLLTMYAQEDCVLLEDTAIPVSDTM